VDTKLSAALGGQRRRTWNERRNEGRESPSLAVVASSLGGGASIVGVTHDISRTGLSMLMPQQPTAAHQDVTVHDGDISVELWVRVIDCRPTDDDMYVWHVHVTTADDGWSSIVNRNND
jgi:hypothetical protein